MFPLQRKISRCFFSWMLVVLEMFSSSDWIFRVCFLHCVLHPVCNILHIFT
jgi:hypothetical protein